MWQLRLRRLAYRRRVARFQRACGPGTRARTCYQRFLQLEGAPRASLDALRERWEQFDWWLSADVLSIQFCNLNAHAKAVGEIETNGSVAQRHGRGQPRR